MPIDSAGVDFTTDPNRGFHDPDGHKVVAASQVVVMDRCEKASGGKHCWHILGTSDSFYFNNKLPIGTGMEMHIGCCWCGKQIRQSHGGATETPMGESFIACGPSVVVESQKMDSVK